MLGNTKIVEIGETTKFGENGEIYKIGKKVPR